PPHSHLHSPSLPPHSHLPSPSLPPHSHLPSPSHPYLPSPPTHLPIPSSHVPSSSNLPLPSPHLPAHLPANDDDDDREWRPLEISGSHSTSHSTPSSPLNQSLKWVVEKHRLSSSGNGLFGENDSFLVPLSPHSDFSGGDDEH
ncbi:hypothetical protein GBAR_LOCUS3968, partial [Geodia barretti]